jgi:hypothetical protein
MTFFKRGILLRTETKGFVVVDAISQNLKKLQLAKMMN